jgi:hypothetical protein
MALFNEPLVAGECRPSLPRRQLTRPVRAEIKFTKPTNRSVARATRSRGAQALDAPHARAPRLSSFLWRMSIDRTPNGALALLANGAFARRAASLCLRAVSEGNSERAARNRIAPTSHTPPGLSATSPFDDAADRLTGPRTASILVQTEL